MVVLIACATCAKAKAKCDKKIPCSRCSAKRIKCRPRGDRRFSDGQTELSTADIERIAAANGGTSGVQTPNVSRRPSIGTPSRSRRQSRQNSPRLKLQPRASNSNPINIPCPLAPLSSSTWKEQDNDLDISLTSLSSLRFNPSPEYNPLLANVDPAAIQNTMPLTDQFLPMTSQPMQTDADLPSLDSTIFPEFSVPLGIPPLPGDPSFPGDPCFPGDLNDLHNGNATPVFPPSRTISSDTLPSLSCASSFDGSNTGSRRAIKEHDYIDEVDESWPIFRCNPPKRSTSRLPTSGVYLDGLLSLLKDRETWSSWVSKTHLVMPIPAVQPGFESIDDESLANLTAITQNFLHHAFDVRKARSMNGSQSQTSQSPGFPILPPAEALECFLHAYMRHFETYNVCCPGSSSKPNWSLQQCDAKLTNLLMLSMFAYGAAADSTPEACCLSKGLAEVCRISWQNMIEHDMSVTREPTFLLSQLLLTTSQAWSGENSFMELAMCQRDKHINLLRQAEFLEAQPIDARDLRQHQTIDSAWEHWKLEENRARLVYAWVTLDQEISLFYDIAPFVSISDLKIRLPSANELWQARSAAEWWNRHERQRTSVSPSKTSLCELFRAFVEGDSSYNDKLGPTELRLLLHPLQSTISHLRPFLNCFGGEKAQGKVSSMKTSTVTVARQEEIRAWLHNWYQLASCIKQSSPIMCANLINFHLISLNLLVDFAELERAARGGHHADVSLLSLCIKLIHRDAMEEILMHCGQVLRNIRAIPTAFRPHWWPGAHYRVALIAWAVSITAGRQFEKATPNQQATQRNFFAIDALAPEHASIIRFLKRRSGSPAFSNADWSPVSLASPKKLLAYFSDSLEEDLSLCLTNGIRNKLRRLAERWESTTG